MSPQLTRRTLLVAAAVAASACGSTGRRSSGTNAQTNDSSPVDPPSRIKPVAMPKRIASTTDPALAGRLVAAFGHRLLADAAANTAASENLMLSPLSIAIALGMLEPGTSGEGTTAIHEALGITDAAAFHHSLNALTTDLTARPSTLAADDGELEVNIANRAYLSDGERFLEPFVTAVGTDYGATLETTDFQSDPDAVAKEISEWVAQETNGRITDLIPPGTLRPDTLLALVNALYLKASWLVPMPPQNTANAPFTRADGSTLTVPMMRGTSGASLRGGGWTAAEMRLSGGLRTLFVLPDDGRMEAVIGALGAVIDEFTQRAAGIPAQLELPRFKVESQPQLGAALRRLSLEPLFTPGGLMGVNGDERTALYDALHKTFVAVDETGMEAAAATALLAYTTSAPVEQPVPLRLDRPFIMLVTDNRSGATLFAGRIDDPTIAA